jgi:uncharacterized protein YdeI (YjbR/CyaY-like superfamily)
MPKTLSAAQDLPVLAFADRQAWAAWLARHHASSPGVLIKVARVGSGLKTVSLPEALDEALCYGWIDGTRRSLDETHYLQKYSPRTPRSSWSKINREKVLALIAAGRMQPAGLLQIERAQADGRWDAAYDAPSKATVPDDFAAAMAAVPGTRAAFGAQSSQNRYAMLFRLMKIKRAETRAAKIELFVQMLARGEQLHP